MIFNEILITKIANQFGIIDLSLINKAPAEGRHK